MRLFERYRCAIILCARITTPTDIHAVGILCRLLPYPSMSIFAQPHAVIFETVVWINT